MLSTDLTLPDTQPYFIWYEAITVRDLRRILREGTEAEKLTYLARVLRDARFQDVWAFTTPQEVSSNWPQLAARLGRQRPFWDYIISTWRSHGLII